MSLNRRLTRSNVSADGARGAAPGASSGSAVSARRGTISPPTPGGRRCRKARRERAAPPRGLVVAGAARTRARVPITTFTIAVKATRAIPGPPAGGPSTPATSLASTAAFSPAAISSACGTDLDAGTPSCSPPRRGRTAPAAYPGASLTAAVAARPGEISSTTYAGRGP